MSETCNASVSDATNEKQPESSDGGSRPRPRPRPIETQPIPQETLDKIHEEEAAAAAEGDPSKSGQFTVIDEEHRPLTKEEVEQLVDEIDTDYDEEALEEVFHNLSKDIPLSADITTTFTNYTRGDKALCVDSSGIEELITGGVYTVQGVDEKGYLDLGTKRTYKSSRFTPFAIEQEDADDK